MTVDVSTTNIVMIIVRIIIFNFVLSVGYLFIKKAARLLGGVGIMILMMWMNRLSECKLYDMCGGELSMTHWRGQIF